MSLLSTLLAALASTSKPRTKLPSPGEAITLFNESIGHRAELAALEIDEARDHVVVSTLLGAAVAALVLFAGFSLTLLLASFAWESPHRAWWLTGIFAGYLIGAGVSGFILSHRLKTWRPLDETQNQLQQDYQCLSKLIKSSLP